MIFYHKKKAIVFFVLIQAFLLCSCVTIKTNPISPKNFFAEQTKETNTITAIQISDAHFSKEKYLFKRTMELINELKPDLIFFTGDQATCEESIDIMQKYLSKITVDCPKIAINGNWDYIKYVPRDEYKKVFQQNNVLLLENAQTEYIIDGKKIIIYGLDDYLFGTPSLQNFSPRENAANIVLGHCPPLFDMLPQTEFPLIMLAGHTHGGQFTFFNKAIYFPVGTGEYYAGLYKNGNNTLYVSTGLGNSSLDVRNVAPVIDIITFYFDQQNQFKSATMQPLKVE